MQSLTATASPRRAFHIGDVLSIVTGIVLSPRGPIGVQALYQHLLGRSVSLGEAQKVHRQIRTHVVAHHPALSTFLAAEVPPYEFVTEWVARRAREFGHYIAVPPLPESHPLRTGAGLPSHIREMYESQPNGGWLWAPANWLAYPLNDLDIARSRPELPASPIDYNRPKTTGLGGSGRTLPDTRERNAPMNAGGLPTSLNVVPAVGERAIEAPGSHSDRHPESVDAPKRGRIARGNEARGER